MDFREWDEEGASMPLLSEEHFNLRGGAPPKQERNYSFLIFLGLFLIVLLGGCIGLWYYQFYLWSKYLFVACEHPLANWCMISAFTTIIFLLSMFPFAFCQFFTVFKILIVSFLGFTLAWTIKGSVWLNGLPNPSACPGPLVNFVWWDCVITYIVLGIIVLVSVGLLCVDLIKLNSKKQVGGNSEQNIKTAPYKGETKNNKKLKPSPNSSPRLNPQTPGAGKYAPLTEDN